MEEELKPGDEIPLFCEFCKKETKCRYEGIQEGHKRKPIFKLFTCRECGNTFVVDL
ncbi:MAG: hypothetical protein ISS82_06420 [Nanoarchaeota archaeon]|nr:hypothetical protein [Nanoarchaeota archaeon]